KVITAFLLLTATAVRGQDTLLVPRYTLQQCREMATAALHSSEMRQEALEAARLNQQAALAAMFPKLSANASYMWNSKSPVLLANEMQFDFGTARVGADGMGAFEWSETSYINRLNMDTRTLPDANAQVKSIGAETGQMIADVYQKLYHALNPDMTHVVIGQVGITQPIYVGGRLKALYDIASTARDVAEIEADSKQQELTVGVDEAYWRVVSVEHKKQLAEQYYNLLVTLENNVQELAAEGLATQSDLLKVKAKRGEAEVKKLQAENGLILSKMALCQLIGLPLHTDFVLDDHGLHDILLHDTLSVTDDLLNARSEIQLLDAAEKVSKSNIRLMAAGLQPNIVAQANYVYSNPSVENGFSNQWKGTGFFSAGVVVNIPIVHADDILRLIAAKHEANIVAIKREEAKELLTLQVTQANQKVLEAQQKVTMTEMQVKNAEEVLRFAQEAFDAGMATASDLMQAQTAWQAACSDHIDAEVEAQVAETKYRHYTNTLE
ncbi:MAG: TolC family protein, partial [Paludibacteraceae bacterium]|nr:TolC family protein [Paludibacteraceae bacterium]